MRIALLIALTLPLTGCYTQTNITRTVRHTDGTVETYENKSNGYNYNPNFTGHWDNNYQIRANSDASQRINAEIQPPVSPNGQFTIR
jgi:hypothetical protein